MNAKAARDDRPRLLDLFCGAGGAAMGYTRAGVPDLRFHDLRHFYASGLIFSGLDIKTVQARLRHSSAKTTLDTYGHLWPDQDEPTRAAVEALFRGREA